MLPPSATVAAVVRELFRISNESPALIARFPAVPVPVLVAEIVAPAVIPIRPAVTSMSPPAPLPPAFEERTLPPAIVTGPIALTVTVPPRPAAVVPLSIRAPPLSANAPTPTTISPARPALLVVTDILAPSVSVRLGVFLTSILPAGPHESVLLKTPLVAPSTIIDCRAVIVTLPPAPRVPPLLTLLLCT